MTKSDTYSDKLQGFAHRVKTEPVQMPVQKVTPVEATTEPGAAQVKQEQQLSVWVPKDLMKQLKVRGAETDQSLKDMVSEALSQYLRQ